MGTTLINGPLLKIVSRNGTSDSSIYALQMVRTKASARRKKPSDLITNMTGHHASVDIYNRTIQYTRHPDGFVGSGPHQYQAGKPTSELNEPRALAREQAINRLLSKVKGEVWNLSTFMGELPETWGWLKTTGMALAQTYVAARRGRLREIPRIVERARRRVNRDTLWTNYHSTGNLSDRWLEWRYAVQPLMYDMDDMISYLYRARLKTYIRREAGGGQEKWYSYAEGPKGRISHSQAEIHARALLYYSVNPKVEAFKQLGLINPLATLWELTPLSFVVDWFCPIGDYIANLDAMAGVSVKARSLSTKDVWSSYKTPPCNLNQWIDEPSTSKGESYSRTTAFSLAPPLPRFGISLKSKQVFDSLALVRKMVF